LAVNPPIAAVAPPLLLLRALLLLLATADADVELRAIVAGPLPVGEAGAGE